jgi:ADP-dependent NAD(P)H-hydrate dehydratase / NAD(P)H-hydrate epimerase
LPSGLSGDTPDLLGEAVLAELTVALGAAKLPHMLPPAEDRCGEVVVAEIGVPPQVIESLEEPRIEVITRSEVLSRLAPRAAESHKGDYGRVLVVAGGVGKTGAACLAGMAALRSGAGLVTIATPRSALPIVASMAPEYMTLPLVETRDGIDAEAALQTILEFPADVIAIGPGLGAGDAQRALVLGLLERSGVPLVMDADALNVCVQDPRRLRGRDGLEIVITPHPGELARLLGRPIDAIQADRLGVARAFATEHNLHVVLKGHRTLVASPGGTIAINRTGNPGMATGGTGDVLTGVIAAWIAQLLDAEAACRAGVHLHGLAGDLARDRVGEAALTAGELLGHLPNAWLEVRGRRPRPDEE